MKREKTVLTLSRDLTLQRTRSHLLWDAGYDVIESRSEEDFIRVVESRPKAIDLLVICHSLPKASRTAIVKRARAECPAVPILYLYNAWDDEDPVSKTRSFSTGRMRGDLGVSFEGYLRSTEATPIALLSMVGLLTNRLKDTQQTRVLPQRSYKTVIKKTGTNRDAL